MNATNEQHIQIATIIGYVDAETDKTSVPYEVYQLENQDPNKLCAILKQLYEETILQKSSSTSTDATAKIVAPSTATIVKKIEENITIVPDPSTYSLIVYANKSNQLWIGSLIKQLDQYRPQVLLDVTLVEVTKDDAFNYEIDLVTKLPEMVGGGTMQGTSAKSSQGVTGPAALVSPFPNNQVIEGSSFGGQGSAFYADRHVQALLTAMQTKGYGRVLAKPKILTNDNQPGVIKTEDVQNVVQLKSSIIPTSHYGRNLYNDI